MNRSTTYVYPIILILLGLIHSNFFNSYVYGKTENTLVLVYSFTEKPLNSPEFKNFILNKIKLHNSKMLVDTITSSDSTKIAYVLNTHGELKEHIDLFKNGSFSKFNEKNKYRILNYLSSYYKEYPDTIKDIKGILFRDSEFREALSEELGVRLTDDMELSSKPDMLKETFVASVLEEHLIEEHSG